MLLLLVALTTIGFGLYGFLKYRYSYWKRKGIKQTGTSWILGDNLRQMLMQEHFADMIKRLHDMHVSDRYVGGYQMMIPTLLVNDLDLIKTICVKDFDHFSNHRTFVPEDVDPLFGKNLFALKGKETLIEYKYTSCISKIVNSASMMSHGHQLGGLGAVAKLHRQSLYIPIQFL
nr:unnamed protein product [Callosobruchus chinensis]